MLETNQTLQTAILMCPHKDETIQNIGADNIEREREREGERKRESQRLRKKKDQTERQGDKRGEADKIGRSRSG